MYSITKRIPKLAGLALLALTAACSTDRVVSAVAPTADASLEVAAPALPSEVMKQAIVAQQAEAPLPGDDRFHTNAMAYPSNAVSYQFVVNPTMSQSFIMGVHMVSFPANTICDPAASNYGPNYWLNSCPKLTTPIVIYATTWTDAQGRAQIDFANSLRFYRNSWGMLPAIYLRDPWAAESTFGRIDYCTTGGACVNEAASDAVLKTQRESTTGYLFRIIRHFSGYNVWA
jgi:hypothetical protein